MEPSDITINGDFNFLKNLKVNGSVSNLEFERYNQLLDTTNKRINTIQEQIHLKPKGEKVTDQITIDSLKEELNNEIVHFMMNHNKSYVFLSELHSECYLAIRHLNKEQIKNVYNNFSNELRRTVKGIEIKKYLELPDPPKIGDMAPEIIQVTLSGDTVKLSDYKGKYVLLDFWSSSCGPCRGEFKGLRKLYSKYNPKGFEIFGVSGDTNKRRWVDAIKQDSIPWVNISDLKGWKNEAFLLYDVKMIPKKFLINPEGVIIKDSFSEYSVEYELNKIFEIKNGL